MGAGRNCPVIRAKREVARTQKRQPKPERAERPGLAFRLWMDGVPLAEAIARATRRAEPPAAATPPAEQPATPPAVLAPRPCRCGCGVMLPTGRYASVECRHRYRDATAPLVDGRHAHGDRRAA
jgi:hypothetical protein